MKISDLFRSFKKKEDKAPKNGRFADFFLNASEEEQKAVIGEAVRRANEEQKRVFLKSTVKQGN